MQKQVKKKLCLTHLLPNNLLHPAWSCLYLYKYHVLLAEKRKLSYLSYDVAPGSEITLCNKINKPLVVYRFTGNVMTSITTLRTL